MPLKFRLYDGTPEVTDPGVLSPFSVRPTSCSTSEATLADEIEFTTTGPTHLRYVDGSFQQNWKTPKTTGCYHVAIGASLTATFRLR